MWTDVSANLEFRQQNANNVRQTSVALNTPGKCVTFARRFNSFKFAVIKAFS